MITLIRLEQPLNGSLTTTIAGKAIVSKDSDKYITLEKPIKLCEFNRLVDTENFIKDQKGNVILDEKGNPQKEKLNIIEAQTITDTFLRHDEPVHFNLSKIEFMLEVKDNHEYAVLYKNVLETMEKNKPLNEAKLDALNTPKIISKLPNREERRKIIKPSLKHKRNN